MKKITCVALVLLALSSGAVQAQELPSHHDVSWAAHFWEALADLVEAIFTADPKPTPPPSSTVDSDCGSFIDPTGGCRG